MFVDLSAIPTLCELYASGALRAVAASLPVNARFPPSQRLLDRVSLYQGDITKVEVDSIVNAAKRSLLGGGGVDGAIHQAAGPKLVEECETLDGCETGDAKITAGYNLPSKHVIHTVGPVYSRSRAEQCAHLLASCYRRSLQIASQHSLKHIAFPSISTGIYGYPVPDATHIALKETRKFLDSEDSDNFDRVIFVVFSDEDMDVYQELVPLYFPPDESA
ncbi:hypothetical protein QCA50_005659 [Cerrena zonata]|uniref:Macro domain-containing protein n=1 Tax=Cerrena zonata TaxID=2478898 RepID=A0AAW0GAZ3_9APHY